MDPMSYLVEVRHNFFNKPGSYEVFLQTMKDFKAQQINTSSLIKNLAKLFKGHNNLIQGFNEFLPKEYKIVSKEDDEALDFVKRVQKTFKDDHGAFFDFLEIINTYRCKTKSIVEVYKEIKVLFQGHRDLLFEFKSFLPNTKVKRSISPPLDIVCTTKKRKIEETSVRKRVRDSGLAFFDKVKATVSDCDICPRLMKCVEIYGNGILTSQELQDLVHDLIGEYPELVKGFDAYMENSEKTKKSEDICSSKYMEENVEYLALLRCEKISPSYRRLPMSYRKPVIMNESLNDGFVCVAPMKDNFKVRSKNQYAGRLFKCEDEMFELDMQIHLITATINSAEALLPEVKKSHQMGKNSYLCLEEHFPAQQLGCINKLFKQRCPEFLDSLRVNEEHFSAQQLGCTKKLFKRRSHKFLDSLRENPFILLPIALKQLTLEQEELSQIHNDSKLKWRNIFKDNHRRSLGLK